MTTAANHRRTMRTLAAAAIGIAMAAPGVAAERHPAFLKTGVAVSAPKGAVGLCGKYGWACHGGGAASASAKQALALADRVNREVNRRVRPVSDSAQYGREEYWALPGRRGGDCEDYALEKKRQLMEMGLSGKQLLLTTVLDRKGGSHAVLVLRTGAGDYVLDNLTNQIKPWGRTGYTFLRMQDPQRPQQWRALFAGGLFSNPTASANN